MEAINIKERHKKMLKFALVYGGIILLSCMLIYKSLHASIKMVEGKEDDCIELTETVKGLKDRITKIKKVGVGIDSVNMLLEDYDDLTDNSFQKALEVGDNGDVEEIERELEKRQSEIEQKLADLSASIKTEYAEEATVINEYCYVIKFLIAEKTVLREKEVKLASCFSESEGVEKIGELEKEVVRLENDNDDMEARWIKCRDEITPTSCEDLIQEAEERARKTCRDALNGELTKISLEMTALWNEVYESIKSTKGLNDKKSRDKALKGMLELKNLMDELRAVA